MTEPPIPIKPRVLFVEDDATLRAHLARTLSDEYIIDAAANGTEALRAVMGAKPDLVVTDIMMPDMNGVELLRALRSVSSTRAIPVLLISGHAPEAQRIEGFKEGADGYLAKPYTERELRAIIGSMLRSARLRNEMARDEARKRAERQALTDRALLLESISDAFYALDAQGHITYVNQRALDYYGKTGAELLGRSVWEVFPAAKGTVIEAQYERAHRERCQVSSELLSPVTGRWIDLRVYPAGEGLAVHVRDISDRKFAEESLLESDRRKNEFLALLAHELRNPLAPIKNGLHILRLRLGDDAISQRTLEMMDRQMNHVAHLVDDLLDVSRITQGKLQLRTEKVLLAEVLESAVEASRALIEAHAHELVVNVGQKELVVEADADRLVQVFSNLLSNAAKYTHRGGRIAVNLDREDALAMVTVQDNGIGIPGDALESIFQMFAQLPTQDPGVHEGLGIGLALVRTLVQMHGGTIRAASDGLGTGSTFTVRLPLTHFPTDVRSPPSQAVDNSMRSTAGLPRAGRR